MKKRVLSVVLMVVVISALLSITAFAYEPSPMPDYSLNIFEQIIAALMSVWKYLLSFLPF